MARETRKSRRASEIRQRAREMASTGEYSGWLIIEQMLRFKHGYPEARSVLDNIYARQELDEICGRAKARNEAASGAKDVSDPPVDS